MSGRHISQHNLLSVLPTGARRKSRAGLFLLCRHAAAPCFFRIFARLFTYVMTIEEVRAFCLRLPLVTEDSPFGPNYVVFRVMGKIFVCLDLDRPGLFAAKCEPGRAEALREAYAGIVPAWHWNKRRWNDVSLAGDVPRSLAVELLVHAHGEVIDSLPAALRREYARLCAASGAEQNTVQHNKAAAEPLRG